MFFCFVRFESNSILFGLCREPSFLARSWRKNSYRVHGTVVMQVYRKKKGQRALDVADGYIGWLGGLQRFPSLITINFRRRAGLSLSRARGLRGTMVPGTIG
jgi:hypothetical protein